MAGSNAKFDRRRWIASSDAAPIWGSAAGTPHAPVTGIAEIVAGAKGVTMGEDMTRAEFARQMKDVEDRIKGYFEETQRLVRLSLERLDTGRETTERGLADLRREGHQLRALLESRLTHVSHRVDRLDRRS